MSPNLSEIIEVHRSLADSIWPGSIVCQACGRREEPNRDQVAGYLARGWPRCCGQTMSYERSSQEAS